MNSKSIKESIDCPKSDEYDNTWSCNLSIHKIVEGVEWDFRGAGPNRDLMFGKTLYVFIERHESWSRGSMTSMKLAQIQLYRDYDESTLQSYETVTLVELTNLL